MIGRPSLAALPDMMTVVHATARDVPSRKSAIIFFTHVLHSDGVVEVPALKMGDKDGKIQRNGNKNSFYR
jgi:hypothetical protein